MKTAFRTVCLLALAVMFMGCAHSKAKAPTKPGVAKADPAPKAEAPKPEVKPQPPRQYEGPPPNRPPVKQLTVDARDGWRGMGGPGVIMLIHPETNSKIMLRAFPKEELKETPKEILTKIREAFKQAKLKAKPVRCDKKGTCSFTYLDRTGIKRGIMPLRGKLQLGPFDDEVVLLARGEWPAQHNRKMLKEMRLYLKSLKIATVPATKK